MPCWGSGSTAGCTVQVFLSFRQTGEYYLPVLRAYKFSTCLSSVSQFVNFLMNATQGSKQKVTRVVGHFLLPINTGDRCFGHTVKIVWEQKCLY